MRRYPEGTGPYTKRLADLFDMDVICDPAVPDGSRASHLRKDAWYIGDKDEPGAGLRASQITKHESSLEALEVTCERIFKAGLTCIGE